jgi:Forkhead domain
VVGVTTVTYSALADFWVQLDVQLSTIEACTTLSLPTTVNFIATHYSIPPIGISGCIIYALVYATATHFHLFWDGLASDSIASVPGRSLTMPFFIHCSGTGIIISALSLQWLHIPSLSLLSSLWLSTNKIPIYVDKMSHVYSWEPSSIVQRLRDGPPGSKPFYPYSTLIRYAIKGSHNQKLLLEDIYYAIESRFPYFKTAPTGWKVGVRILSLLSCWLATSWCQCQRISRTRCFDLTGTIRLESLPPFYFQIIFFFPTS